MVWVERGEGRCGWRECEGWCGWRGEGRCVRRGE